jgi:transcription elongation factor Elf1
MKSKDEKRNIFVKKYECIACGEKQKVYRMFDIDGTNLVEALVCLNCRNGALPTKDRNI